MTRAGEFLAILARYPVSCTAFALPQEGLDTFACQDGTVAYTDSGGFWVGVSGAVGPRPQEAWQAFCREAERHGRQAALFGTPAPPAGWPALPIGQEATWDPRRWEQTLDLGSIRSMLRRATRKGVHVLESNEDLDAELRPLVLHWRMRQAMPPMGFVARTDPLATRPGVRRFVARQGERALGFLVAVPLGTSRWLLEFLVLNRPVPQGTAEALVDFAMRALAEAGATRVSMGLTALAGVPRSGLLASLLVHAAERLNWLYGFRGIRAFRARLRPDWTPLFLAYPPGYATAALWAVLKAFARGHPDRFALGTARRLLARPALVRESEGWAQGAEFLAGALVPWTALLWLCDSERWFGCGWLARAWASFDTVMLLLLALLGHGLRRRRRRWVRPLAWCLFGATLADVWMTCAQAVLYNLPNARTIWDYLGMAVGLSGPPLAALYLWLLLLRAPLRR
ncbi:MAG: phosphatidylglycerol lysyltransferase domain-containing protein [Candidatus Eremiobacterota bacterium]